MGINKAFWEIGNWEKRETRKWGMAVKNFREICGAFSGSSRQLGQWTK
jgi:hypothetical protein